MRDEIRRRAGEIIERFAAGETVYQIAADIGCHTTELHRLMVREAEDVWRETQVARALARLEEAERELDEAADGLTLARARERIRSAQWTLERLLRRIYGDSAPGLAAAVQVNIRLD